MRSGATTTPILGGIAALCAGLLAGPVAADVSPPAGMLRFPDVGPTKIVFMYANDLWVVDKSGGTAMPLASPDGAEMFPKFSADGSTIAFMGNYDGNRDIYTIPTGGGTPMRVTHHPAGEMLADWTPDGGLLFSHNGMAGNPRTAQLYTVGAEGGMPEKLPVPYGTVAAISPDGEWLAYTPYSRDFRTWKRYMGGLAADIWLFNLRDHSAKRATDWGGTDTAPMWHGDTMYYLSDGGPEHRLNIWSYDPATSRRTQVTKFADYDVKFPSIYSDGQNGEIVFQNGSSLRLLDLRTGQSSPIEVRIPGDQTASRPRNMNVAGFIAGWSISPNGKRAAAEARGDIWSLPAEKGIPRNLTRTSGVAERDPAWSPDGRWIAYFSDESGEYEMYVTQSDGKGETKQLTSNGGRFRYAPNWSPDSKMIIFADKAGEGWLHDIESGETTLIDTDPWGQVLSFSWSHDSRWITYSRTDDRNPGGSIWIHNIESGEKHRVTGELFNDASPTFDRKGKYLFFSSNRSFSPEYDSMSTSFIYPDSAVLLAVPLREDVENPWIPELDEEEFDDEEDEEEGDDEDGDDENGDDEDGDDEDEGEDGDDEDGDDEEAAPDDGVSGSWDCTLTGPEPMPAEGIAVSMFLSLEADGSITGSVSGPMGSGTLAGTYDAGSGNLTATITTDTGEEATMVATIKDGTIKGTVSAEGMSFDISGERSSSDEDGDGGGDDDEAVEEVEIDFEGFERRAMLLPVSPGAFGRLAVNDKNQLIYTRRSARGGSGAPSIRLFDMDDDDRAEKTVASGAGAFDISGNGKKLLVLRGPSATIQNASAGASGKPVPTSGMMAKIDPRAEWGQILKDAWRIQRDFFYDPDMHGVDWPAVYEQYAALIPYCANREDVSYLIGEMIGELNVGHAYYFGGDTESAPSVSVGMLGADFEMGEGAYRIAKIHEGGPWDADARGPLSQPGIDAKEGDYLLAVNGVPVDTTKDPWAAFTGLAGRTVVLTLSDTAEMTEDAREVIVTPISGETGLRYRAWVEANRKYVEEQTEGRIGYIHVPDTGVNGQNNLYRQYFGQIGKEGLIVDERWNGGGQIPTRFIELMNRPVTNYWARRDGNSWPWPPDAHRGPKCMLINGPSGSGGDAFPHYFRQSGLGKLIGTRTWGGLVGISGNPALIDGGYTAVPTFGYYENDGTWGIEGHGVDPDIEILDDPSKMVDGGDPQLDAAIEHMLGEVERMPWRPTPKPAYPDRSGMGIDPRDK